MFYDDGTFSFHEEIMAIVEKFCQEWVKRKGPFGSRLEGALVLNFALCTIKHDLEDILDQLEWQPVFRGISPKEVYERDDYGAAEPKGLTDRDVIELVEKSLRRLRRN